MLIKKVLVGTLAILFCLAIAGVALAENEYENVFASSDQTISATHMGAGHDMNAEAGKATPEQKQQVDNPNSRPVVCAASFHDNDNLTQDHANYCKELYGS